MVEGLPNKFKKKKGLQPEGSLEMEVRQGEQVLSCRNSREVLKLINTPCAWSWQPWQGPVGPMYVPRVLWL